MSKLNLDRDKIQACREIAKKIAQRAYRDVEKISTVSIEGACLRFIGLEDAYEGKPVASAIVEAIPKESLGKGALYWFGRALTSQRTSPIALALRVASGKVQLTETPETSQEEIQRALEPLIRKGFERLSSVRQKREQAARWPNYAKPMKYVEVGTGDVDQDIAQAQAAVAVGADCIAICRSAAQSLMEYVPSGETHEGREGTLATQANFRKLRRAFGKLTEQTSSRIRLAHSSSGLCMPEIALIASFEHIDYLLNDALYGILFRDINAHRAFADQSFARLLLARSGVTIHTGESQYSAHSDSYRIFPQVLGSHFLNEQFSFLSQLSEWQMGFSHSFQIDPDMEDGLLYELAQAQMVRECFPKAPIKYMPPTRHKTGDIFYSHVMDGLFTLVGAMTHQDIQQLGMATEAIHHPLLMDRYWSLKAANYVLKNTRSLGDEIQWLMNGKVVRRARSVLDGAYRLLQKIDKVGGLFRAISNGYFSNISRSIDQGVGRNGLISKDPDYWNPIWDALLSARPERESMAPSPGRRRADRRPSGRSDRRPSNEAKQRGRRVGGSRGSRSRARGRSQSGNRESDRKEPPESRKEPPESRKEPPEEKATEVMVNSTVKESPVASKTDEPTKVAAAPEDSFET